MLQLRRGSERPVRAVLFDLDGTLYDRDAALRSFAAEQYGRRRDVLGAVAQEQFVGEVLRRDANGTVGKEAVYRQILEEIGGDPSHMATLYAEYRERFCLHCRPPVELASALATLRLRGLKLGVITNGSTVMQQRTLAALELAAFDAILISEAEGLRKPDPAIFLRATERLGIEPAAAVFVGDNPEADVGGARGAGLRGTWLANPFHPPPAADATISNIAELPAILAAW